MADEVIAVIMAAGIALRLDSGVLENCNFYGQVEASGNPYVGGISSTFAFAC